MLGRRWVAAMIAAAVGCGLWVAGCAQNVEPSNRTTQSTEGSQAPQKMNSSVAIYGGDCLSGAYASTSRPAEDRVAGGDALAGTVTQDAGRGKTAASGVRSGGNTVIVNIWGDQKGLAKNESGDMSPEVGPNTQSPSSTQHPEAPINIPFSAAFGMNPSATSDGTQAYNGNAERGAASVDQSGTRSVTQLKAASDQIGGWLKLLSGWKAGGIQSVPIETGATAADGSAITQTVPIEQAIAMMTQQRDELLAQLRRQQATSRPASQPGG